MVQRGTRTAFIRVMQMSMLLLLCSCIFTQIDADDVDEDPAVGGLMELKTEKIQLHGDDEKWLILPHALGYAPATRDTQRQMKQAMEDGGLDSEPQENIYITLKEKGKENNFEYIGGGRRGGTYRCRGGGFAGRGGLSGGRRG